MKMTLIAVAVLLSFASAATAQEKQAAKSTLAPALEAKVRKVWEDFKNKNKLGVAAATSDDFRDFEEGTSTFGDKKAQVASVDDFEIKSYTLKDFTVKSLGPHSALVTYLAHYEGKSGNEAVNANSAFAEVWVQEGNDWKVLYLQETYVK